MLNADASQLTGTQQNSALRVDNLLSDLECIVILTPGAYESAIFAGLPFQITSSTIFTKQLMLALCSTVDLQLASKPLMLADVIANKSLGKVSYIFWLVC